VEKELTNYMVNEKLDIFAQPLPLPENDAGNINVDNPADYAFAFEVGLKPEFNLPDLSKAEITRFKVEPTDQMVNDEMNRLQLRHGKMEEPEIVSSEDNMLNVKFIEADQAGNEIEGGIQKDNALLVKYFAKSVRNQWMEMKAGDHLLLQLSSAFDDREREWVIQDLGLSKGDPTAGNKFFKVVITKVGLVVKAELNEEFFKVAYPAKEIKTEQEFKNIIKEEMQQHWERQSRNLLQHEIYHLLIDETKIEFPETFLKRWLKQGTDQQRSAEEVEQEYPHFLNQLKWTLISEKMFRENNLEVSQEDIKSLAKQQLAGYMGMSELDESQTWVTEYLNRMMQDKKFVEDSYHRLQNDKVLHWAETRVVPVNKEIGVEEFHHLQHKHQH